MAPDTVKELCLPSEPESASRARAEVRDWLGENHPAYEPVRLAVSELVTNAVRHARHGVSGSAAGTGIGESACAEPLILRLEVYRDRVRVEVIDWGLTLGSPRVLADAASRLAEGFRKDPTSRFTEDFREESASRLADNLRKASASCPQEQSAPRLLESFQEEPAFLLAEGGRGLAIVDMLSQGCWGFHPNPDAPGRTVWCEIPAIL